MSDLANRCADDIERIENSYDALLFKLAAIESANEETVTGAVIGRLMEGKAPLVVRREHRGLSRAGLAEAATVIVELHGADLGLRKMPALVKVLRIDAEDLLPWVDTSSAEY